MLAWLTWSVLGGVASALCYGLGPMVFWAPLPIYLTVLRHGGAAGGLAAALAALLISQFTASAVPLEFAAIGPLNGLFYFSLFGGSTALIGFVACLRAGTRSGYVSPALPWMTIAAWGGGLFLLMVAFHGVEGLQQAMTAQFQALLKQMPGPPLDPAGEREIVAQMVSMAPAVLGLFWGLLQQLNLAVAQRMLTRRGASLRPASIFAGARLPLPLLAIFALLLAASMMGGDVGYVAKTLAAFVAVPYVLAGLAFAHAATRKWPLRWLALTVLYVFLTLYVLLAAPVLVALGIWDQFSNLRGRKDAGSEEE